MKANAHRLETPKSKSRPKPNAKNNLKSLSLPETKRKVRASSDHFRRVDAQNQLTEAGPLEIAGGKTNPFRKFLNNLWGPIRG
jgi:hypothetical protein